MSEYTSITTDMRMLMGCFTGFTEFERDKFERLCDAIDAIHANLERENESLRRELDRVVGEHDGWVELPKDADGVPIRVGDVMEWPTTYETFEVVGIGDGTLFYIEDGSEQADWTGASTKRHHHAPTVEDVLREFAEKITDSQIPGIRPTYEEAIAEYAAKLRLAGE